MGSIIKISCKKCGRSWDIKTGMGMTHALLENCLDDFTSDVADKIRKNFEGQEFPHYTFMYRAAICNKCGKVISVAQLEDLDTKQKYTAACPGCGSYDVTIIDDKLSTTQCPNCGHHSLTSETSGLWD